MGSAPVPDQLVDPCFAISRKDLITTSLGPASLWATAAQGIPTEIFWPSPGDPQIKDLGFIVATDDRWCEVKAQESYSATVGDFRVPLAEFVHTGPADFPYQLSIRLVPDPQRDAVLVAYELTGLPGAQLFAMCAARLRAGHFDMPQNWGWSEGGRLFACTTDETRYLCLDAAGGFSRPSAAFYASTDLWHDFSANGRMTWQYDSAGPGPIVLGGQLTQTTGTLVVSFAGTVDDARAAASAGLALGAAAAQTTLTEQWLQWAADTAVPAALPDDPPGLDDALQWAATTIRVHQDRGQPGGRTAGAVVASMSRPWGDTRTEPGYYLVWPRDACEAGLALIAIGHTDDAEQLLEYLFTQQSDDGHWRQNFFPDGTDYWSGVQLDETALPVLLAATLDDAGRSPDAAAQTRLAGAVGFLARTGPRSDQDRWEEDPGTSPFSLGAAIAALVAGAAFLDDPDDAAYALNLADFWHERLEELTYVEGSYLDALLGLGGHYVRIGPSNPRGLLIKNRETALYVPTAGVLGMEFAYLCRLGLRSAASPAMTDTITLVDALLGRCTGTQATYLRYNYDGYGELIDGQNWDGSHGLGRPWPILAGERGVYEVAAGRSGIDQLLAMLGSRTDTGYLPEQVWDQPPVLRYPPGSHLVDPAEAQPSASLYFGKPSLSATPLVWAHAELIKLACARAAGQPLEILPAVAARYAVPRTPSGHWRRWHPFPELQSGRALVVEDLAPFELSYRLDGGATQTRSSVPLSFGLHGVTLAGTELAGVATVIFRLGNDPSEQQVAITDEPQLTLRAHSDRAR